MDARLRAALPVLLLLFSLRPLPAEAAADPANGGPERAAPAESAEPAETAGTGGAAEAPEAAAPGDAARAVNAEAEPAEAGDAPGAEADVGEAAEAAPEGDLSDSGVPAEQERAPDKASYFELDAEGKPVFTQVLRWEADPNAGEYGVVLRDAGGAVLLDARAADAFMEVHLSPGVYAYRIVTYNLLGRADAETDWLGLEVIKAEQPELASWSPRTLYMDTLDGRVTVVGSKLLEKGTISLIAADGRRYAGTAASRKGDSEVVLVFPEDAYNPGTYALYAENPGGLSAKADGALLMRFQRPVDLLLSAGWAPDFALQDPWYVDSWGGRFHVLGFQAQASIYFAKKRWGLVGLDFGVDFRRLTGGDAGAVLTSDFLLWGVDGLYKYRFARRVHGLVRLGGGLARSSHSFDYDGFAGPSATSVDPFVRGGLAVQYFFPSKVFLQSGIDVSQIFLKGHSGFALSPQILVGYQLY